MQKKQIFVILIAVCVLVYANSLHNAFVSDDIPGIADNPDVGKLSHSLLLQPNSLLNFISYSIAKYNVAAYHSVNIILHCVNVILVFIFLSLFFTQEASLLGALIFAVHPVHAEAVGWPSGKNYLIQSLFIFGIYFLYYRATQNNKKFKLSYYFLSLAAFFYFIIYEVNFFLFFPFFLILYDVTFGRVRKNWKLWVPFLTGVAVRVIFAKAQILLRATQVSGYMSGGNPVWINPIHATAYSLFSNFSLLVWPAKLTLYHEPAVISEFYLKAGIICLIALVAVLAFTFRRAKEIFFAVVIFILFLAPTYSPVPIAWLVAERYLYFPSVALSIFLAFFYERYAVKLPESKKQMCIFIIMFIIAAFSVRAVARNEDWKTPERFWRQTLIASPFSPRAHNNMGDVYTREGNSAGALAEFKKAIELKPDYAEAYHNLASTYERLGNLAEAMKLYQQAVSLNPKIFESQYNLGILYLRTGQLDLAEDCLIKARGIKPDENAVNRALDLVAGARLKMGNP